jgi:hypothetical protein
MSILVIYSLLPENYRYSRALIIIGAGLAFCITTINRLVLRLIRNKGKSFSILYRKNALIIGSQKNESFIQYPKKLDKDYEICHSISINSSIKDSQNKFNNLSDIIFIYKIESIIFFLKDVDIEDIINCILKTKEKKLEFKIVLPENTLMIGPQSVINLNSIPNFKIDLISTPTNKFYKRLFDLLLTAFLIPLVPLFLVYNKPTHLFGTLYKIIIGKITWVSYFNHNSNQIRNLPILPKGIFTPVQFKPSTELSDKDIYEKNLNYAKNYQIKNDIIIIFNALKKSFDFRLHSEKE